MTTPPPERRRWGARRVVTALPDPFTVGVGTRRRKASEKFVDNFLCRGNLSSTDPIHPHIRPQVLRGPASAVTPSC
jgi:hypothetical protein